MICLLVFRISAHRIPAVYQTTYQGAPVTLLPDFDSDHRMVQADQVSRTQKHPIRALSNPFAVHDLHANHCPIGIAAGSASGDFGGKPLRIT